MRKEYIKPQVTDKRTVIRTLLIQGSNVQGVPQGEDTNEFDARPRTESSDIPMTID